jgi:hypothetical protein
LFVFQPKSERNVRWRISAGKILSGRGKKKTPCQLFYYYSDWNSQSVFIVQSFAQSTLQFSFFEYENPDGRLFSLQEELLMRWFLIRSHVRILKIV